MSNKKVSTNKNKAQDISEDVFGVIYTTFGEIGPKIQNYFPKVLNYNTILEIILRLSSSVLPEIQSLNNHFSIFPFSKYNMQVFSYFYEEPTENPGRPITAAISLLINESVSSFLFDYMLHFKQTLKDLSEKLNLNKNLRLLRLSEFYLNLLELINRHKTLQMITNETREIEESDKRCVLLSYFNSKIGPTPIYCYPENAIDEEMQIKISKEIEMNIEKGFYTRTYPNFIIFNYYFEIPSKLARGNMVMCLISLIFDKMPPEKTLNLLSFYLSKMLDILYQKEEISLGFQNDIDNLENNSEKIKEMNEYLKQWVREIYNVYVKLRPLK